MPADDISRIMKNSLQKVTTLLSKWLEEQLSRSGEAWWEECVVPNLDVQQRTTVNNHSLSTDTFDLGTLIHIADQSWYVMQSINNLPGWGLDCLRALSGVYRRWSANGETYKADTLLKDISTLSDFFHIMGEYQMIDDLQELKSQIHASSDFEVAKPVSVSNMPQEIQEKMVVEILATPGKKGMVFSVSNIGGTRKYEVFVDGTLKSFYEGQIIPENHSSEITWIDADTLRSTLSAYQINHPSAGNLYSLNAARIDFVPYQFRPALKLIKSDEPRMLIADSVGVGKTIEAGLIIKELEARSDIESILIICPKPLVADRKWENEMRRFDEEFTPIDGKMLKQILSDTDMDGEWPIRYSKLIVPYSILDAQIYEGEESRRGKRAGLIDLDPAPHFDLVIIDEAHHLRNGSLDKEKAFAYKCAHYFCEHSDAVVMLTATPLQTSDDDLYTLLNLLRPDIVIDKKSFQTISEPNPYISRSAHIIRNAKENWAMDALEQLEQIPQTKWGNSVICQNPIYQKTLRILKQKQISREERVQLITDVESLHSFSTMLNRTRRKDIQDFCIRRTYTLENDFTDSQLDLHNALLDFESHALARLHGNRGVHFMMTTLRRQAASCIFGLAPHIKAIIERRFDQLMDDPDMDYDAPPLSDDDIVFFQSQASKIITMAASLPENDPKFDSIMEIIRNKQGFENNKIILFSSFRYTLAYLKKKLAQNGIRAEQIDGSVNNEKRLELRYRFELPKYAEDAVDILLFTEVGSEGLDYQFCDTMINYDLPWNPMRVEQRIGRIDRRGQKSEAVSIYNVITSNTVDADIYFRCLLRIGVFERSIGECEQILGEIGRQIEAIAMDSRLSDTERREKLEQMADNEIRKAQELSRLEDEEKELFGFDLSSYTMAKEIHDADSPFLSPSSLRHLVDKYLEKRLGPGQYIRGELPLKTLRLSAIAKTTLLEDSRKLPGARSELRKKWELFLKEKSTNHDITFDSETAEKNRNAFFITPVHPLIRQAASFFATESLSYVHLIIHTNDLPIGNYPVSIFAWDYVGGHSSFKLMPVCENRQLAKKLPALIMDAESSDYDGQIDPDWWKKLEELHIGMWKDSVQQHKREVEQYAAFKRESLRSSYRNQELVLKRRIAEAQNPKIITMRERQLINVTLKYEQRVANIDMQAQNADIHTTLIAHGIITVR